MNKSILVKIQMTQNGKCRIGISNVTVPGNKNTFPPAFQLRSRLHYYSTIFNTVEVNRSFYKTPMFSTYEKWALDVPDNFQFSLKMSKEITHAKNLECDNDCLGKFMQAASGIGNKKGCLLIQFPGKISLDYFNRVEEILQELQKHDPGPQWKKAVEFRNPSWYTGETFELLDQYQAVTVLHDFKKAKFTDVSGKGDFVYMRFHGPAGDYGGSYENRYLKSEATRIKRWLAEGKDVYAYFNNTIGSAFENAISLKEMLD